MNYGRFLLLTVYSIALAGWGALWVSSRLHPVWMLATLAALLIGAVTDRRGKHLLKPSWNRALLVLGLSLSGLDWWLGSGNWFLALVLLLLYVTAVRALSPKANRDLAQMIGLAFLQLLAGSVLTLDLGYALFFLIFFLLAPWSLLAVAVKAELEGEGDLLRGAVAEEGAITIPPGAERVLNRGILVSMTVAIVMTMVVTVLFFLAFPRLSTGQFSGRLGLEQPVSGLSEEVNLSGSGGTILENSTPAARIAIEHGPRIRPEDFYLRAIALDRFNGVSWRSTLEEDGTSSPHGRFALTPSPQPATTHRFRVILEDLGTNLLPVVPLGIRLRVPRDRIEISRLGTLRLPNQDGGIRYRVDAAPSAYWQDVPWDELEAPSRLPSGVTYFTRLPAGGLPPAITAASAGAGRSLAWVGEQMARFQTWSYTAELPDSDRPLAAFLQRQAGHCELFATTMALMLRQAGVPAVVVNGFRGGEYLLNESYLLVRERNAHSWVEAWLPSYGWVPLDPTPSTPEPTGLWARTRETWQGLIDGARFYWMDYVVAYDLSTQASAVEAARDSARQAGKASREWRRQFEQWLDELGRGLKWLLVGGVVAVVGMAMVLLMGRRGQRRRGVHGYRSPPVWARRLFREVERRYGARRVGQPLGQWLASLSAPAGAVPALRRFVAAYEAWRFGEEGDPNELRRRARELKRQLPPAPAADRGR